MPVNYADGKIYTLVNNINNTIYVGSTAKSRLSDRMSTHRRNALKKLSPLYVAMRTLGIDNFTIQLHHAFPCTNRNELEAEEYKVMKALIDAGTTLYNARTDVIGWKLTDETKQKIAEAQFNCGSLRLKVENGKFPCWVFQYFDDAGKRRSQSFSVKKYGDYGAHFRAEEARRAVYPEWGNEEDLFCDALGHIE